MSSRDGLAVLFTPSPSGVLSASSNHSTTDCVCRADSSWRSWTDCADKFLAMAPALADFLSNPPCPCPCSRLVVVEVVVAVAVAVAVAVGVF